MSDDPLLLDESLRQEADTLLHGRGLLPILARYGAVHVAGSYALHLMAWRDLDVYLEAGAITVADRFSLGAQVAAALEPVHMSYRNERLARTPDLPVGLYWGAYLGDERAGAWKLDIWAMGEPEYRPLAAVQDGIAGRLTPQTRRAILEIKGALWRHPEYRRSFGSMDIYTAVLEHGVRDLPGFREHAKLCIQPGLMLE